MCTALENRAAVRTVLGHALVRDEHGEEMHKSKGNAIWFDDAADKMGADVMRWLFMRQNPAHNVNFGYGPADEVRRGMFLTLWNTYAFFVTYAELDGWKPRVADVSASREAHERELDRWVLSELHAAHPRRDRRAAGLRRAGGDEAASRRSSRTCRTGTCAAAGGASGSRRATATSSRRTRRCTKC